MMFASILLCASIVSGGGWPQLSFAGMTEPIGPTAGSESSPQAAPLGSAQLAASQRYSEALNALDKGDLAVAQRLFESVIGLDPDGAKAAEARHHLAQLYSQPKSPDVSGQPPPAALPDLRQAAPTEPASQDAPAKASRWSTRYQSLEEEFSGEIGDRVFFSQGSAELGSRAVAIVEAQAAWLKQQSRVNISIEGYADEPALSAEQNQALSEARAVAVRDRMVAEGLAPERLSISPRGREGRISTCGEPQCQVQNRRAVTVLVPKSRALKQPQRQGAEGPTKPSSATQ